MTKEQGDILTKYGSFIQNNYLKNRTIVSSDIRSILNEIEELVDLPMTVHSYPSGAEFATWIIPDQWDVKEAWLKGPDGRIIASYDTHPLFLAPYSRPIRARLSKEELKSHIRCHSTFHDAFIYEYRLAYDINLRLKDWIISLPQNLWDTLKEGEYEICIDVNVKPSEMLIGEIILPGKKEDSIALLTDYCHPGQVNDSFSGILVMMDVLSRLKQIENRQNTYRFFIFPETIGSCVHLHANPDLINTIKFAIFSEFVGWGKDWLITSSKGEKNIVNKLIRVVQRTYDNVKRVHLFEGIGNDELIFDYAGIPSMSVQKTDIPEYHSSFDEPSRLKQKDLQKAADIIYLMCETFEKDRVATNVQNVPVYLSRFNLFKDVDYAPTEFTATRSILYEIDGKKSILDIADELKIDFNFTADFINSLASFNLIKIH